MKAKLLFQACVKFAMGLLFVGLLLFLPAGTFRYWNAWLFITVLFAPMFVAGIVMVFVRPELLAKRLQAKEDEQQQKIVIALTGLMFVVGFVVAGLSFRFGWLPIPTWAVVAASVVFLLTYLLYAEVLRENAYLSRTIEVQENQRVVDTGLYGIVRHPMYSATLLLFLAMPIILGSMVSFLIFLVYPVLIVKRIQNEEKVLELGLDGYTEYTKRVRYRLIPLVW